MKHVYLNALNNNDPFNITMPQNKKKFIIVSNEKYNKPKVDIFFNQSKKSSLPERSSNANREQKMLDAVKNRLSIPMDKEPTTGQKVLNALKSFFRRK